jgi:hypothetical protein
MNALLAAWLVSLGISSWQSINRNHEAPIPGDLLAITGLFAVLGFVAEWNAPLAGLTGWGLVIAQGISLAGSAQSAKQQGGTATTNQGGAAA